MKRIMAVLAAMLLAVLLVPGIAAENIVLIHDDAGLLTVEEEAELYMSMAPVCAYCTPLFWTTDRMEGPDIVENAEELLKGKSGADDGVAFIIDIAHREFAIIPTGEIGGVITADVITQILNNTFRMAGSGDYVGCARETFSGILSELDGTGVSAWMEQPEGELSATETEPEDPAGPTGRLDLFFRQWSDNKLDEMLALCAPSWRAGQENEKTMLFSLLRNRTPVSYELLSKDAADGDSCTLNLSVTIDRHNGKPVVINRMIIRMMNENGEWYIDPRSLQSVEPEEATNPETTPAPAADGNTVLYYNPDGGQMYHLDPNCRSVHPKYQPLKGKFTYAQVNEAPYDGLEPCKVCEAPLR